MWWADFVAVLEDDPVFETVLENVLDDDIVVDDVGEKDCDVDDDLVNDTVLEKEKLLEAEAEAEYDRDWV